MRSVNKTKKIDLQEEIMKLEQRNTPVFDWKRHRRATVKYKGKKTKVRKLITEAARRLPTLHDNVNDVYVDHRANIVKVYCRSGFKGINEYIQIILDLTGIKINKP